MSRVGPAVGLLVLAGWGAAGCGRTLPVAAVAPPAVVVAVPRAPVVPTKMTELLDGRQWGSSYRTEPFVDAHGLHQPHAHLQFMADDANLYVGWYAADEDLRTKPRPGDPRGAVGDRLVLRVGALELVLDPKGGHVPDGVEVLTDVDGTVDDSSNDDEEWTAQVSIPWKLLGPRAREEGLLVHAVRTDAPRREPERASAWPRSGFARLTFASLGGPPSAAR